MNASFEKKNQTQTKQNSHRESNPAQSYPSRTLVHAKLEMTQPGDQDEQEADAVASTIVGGGKIGRQISGGTGGSSGIAVSSQMESQLSRLQGGGRPIPDGLRSMMESGFGQDFSNVRLHTDSEAASMSSSIQAKAFTHGNDIYFNRGQFSPETAEGQRLVAHELTHVVQGTGKVGRQPTEQELENEIDKEIDYYLQWAGRVRNALQNHQEVDLHFRFASNMSRLVSGEKNFSYKLMYRSLKEAESGLKYAKNHRGLIPYPHRSRVFCEAAYMIELLEARLEMYKNNVQHGAEINVASLYLTKTVCFAIAASIGGYYLPGILASAAIGGGIGFIDSTASEISKEANGIESDHLKEIGVSTLKGGIMGGIGGGVGKAFDGLNRSQQVIFNSMLGVGFTFTGDLMTHDIPIEQRRTFLKDREDFLILLHIAFDYGIVYNTKRKKFIWGYSFNEPKTERNFILEYLNDYLEEYPKTIDEIENNEFPIRFMKTDKDLDKVE